MHDFLSHLAAFRAKAHKVGKVAGVSEPWLHVAYCGALFVEGHGVYALVGGALGAAVLLAQVFGGE
jgi:hypothetical protein